MTFTQGRTELVLSDRDAERYAAQMFDVIKRDVAAYQHIDNESTAEDVRRVVRLNVDLFFDCLAHARMPSHEERAVLQDAARRRPQQAIPLEELLTSYRVGIRTMWEFVHSRSPEREHGRLALLTLQYSDLITGAAAQAYVEERQREQSSQREAARLLMTRLLLGEALDEAEVLRDARTLGLELSEPHWVIQATVRDVDDRRRSESDMVLSELRDLIEANTSAVIAMLISSGLVVVVHGSGADATREAVLSALDRRGFDQPFRVGIGTPGAGLSGLVRSHREAVRAASLGALIQPSQLVHDYASMRILDLFREGEAVTVFVQEVLGPVLSLDDARKERIIQTLTSLFGNSLNRKRTAHQLGIHQNTLTMRLNAIEKTLSVRLDSGDLCFRLQLALHLLPLSSSPMKSREVVKLAHRT